MSWEEDFGDHPHKLKGLGQSYNSESYRISGLEEAKVYLEYPVLGQRLREACEIIFGLPTNYAREVLGGINSWKLRPTIYSLK